ncbi:MAG: hypothetical protein FWD47_06720 [Treponema sp.]|nr:hypothetical protein [Treponema sp.]
MKIFNIFNKLIILKKNIFISILKIVEPIIEKCEKIYMKIELKIKPIIININRLIIQAYLLIKPTLTASKILFIPVCIFVKNIFINMYCFLNKVKPVSLFFNIILVLYITIVVILHNINFSLSFKTIIISSLILFIVLYAINKIFILEYDISISRNDKQEMFSRKTIYIFLISSAIIYIIFMVNFTAYYPGGISTDNVDQWKQVQSNTYDNLHPAIHSMIIWLITRIVNNYAFVVKVQILFFSLMTGYMAATIVSWGIKIRWVVVLLFYIISPQTTYGILLYAWKDNAFTISLMCLSAYMINIVFSEGLWLRKWYNIISFSIIFALASLLRHNGIFFTIPVLIFLILFIRKGKLFTILTIIACLLTVNSVTNGIYKKANVEYHEGHTYFEAVGLPMTMLGGILVNKPDALDDDTKQFLFKIASEQYWRRNFRTGDYNSIKWPLYEHQKNIIRDVPPEDFIKMSLQAVKNAPEEALREAIALTNYVWNPFYREGDVIYWNNGSQLGFMYTRAEMEHIQPTKEKYIEINNKIKEVRELITPYRLSTSIGLNMLLLLIVGVYSINRNLGLKSIFLFIPSAAFNICSMLLISGPEWRYFHFNTVITLPLIIALLARVKTPELNKCNLVK